MFNKNNVNPNNNNLPLVSLDEKIDYIYNELRAQKRTKIAKFILKLMIVGFFGFMIYSIFNATNKEILVEEYSKKVGELVTPIVTNITKEIMQNMQGEAQKIDEASIKKILLEQLKQQQ